MTWSAREVFTVIIDPRCRAAAGAICLLSGLQSPSAGSPSYGGGARASSVCCDMAVMASKSGLPGEYFGLRTDMSETVELAHVVSVLRVVKYAETLGDEELDHRSGGNGRPEVVIRLPQESKKVAAATRNPAAAALSPGAVGSDAPEQLSWSKRRRDSTYRRVREGTADDPTQI
jgi:hypothetical protein